MKRKPKLTKWECVRSRLHLAYKGWKYVASMVLALLKIFQCPSWKKIHLLSSPPEQASSLFLAWVHSTGSCDLNWAKVKDFLFAILFSWESVLLCSHTWPTSYFLHKIHLYLRTEQAQSHYSDFTVTEVAKFTKKRGSENTSYILRHKGAQAPWWSATG